MTVKRRSLRTVPLHSSLTRPILLGGAERDLVIIEVSVIAALLFGVGFRFASLSLALYQPFYPATAAVGAPISRVPVFRGDTR